VPLARCDSCPVELKVKGSCYCLKDCIQAGSVTVCALFEGKLKECVNPYLDGRPYETCVGTNYISIVQDPVEVLITDRAEYVEELAWCNGLCGFW